MGAWALALVPTCPQGILASLVTIPKPATKTRLSQVLTLDSSKDLLSRKCSVPSVRNIRPRTWSTTTGPTTRWPVDSHPASTSRIRAWKIELPSWRRSRGSLSAWTGLEAISPQTAPLKEGVSHSTLARSRAVVKSIMEVYNAPKQAGKDHIRNRE